MNGGIEVQNVKAKENNLKFTSGSSSKSNSPPASKGENVLECTDDASRMFTEFDEERSNFFDTSNFQTGPSRNSG